MKWLLFQPPAIYPSFLERGLEKKMQQENAVNGMTEALVGGGGHGQA